MKSMDIWDNYLNFELIPEELVICIMVSELLL